MPSRTDHYIMGVSKEVRSVLSSNPKNIKAEHFRLKFESVKKPPMSVEQAASISKSKWLAFMTMDVKTSE